MELHRIIPIPFFALALCASAVAEAEPTRELSIRGPTEVFQGDPESASVDAQGRVTMGLVATELAKGIDHPVVSLSPGAGGAFYVGTAGGGLFRVSAAGEATVLTDADQLVVSALAKAGGKLFAGTSPDGAIFSVDDAGKRTPFFKHGAKYVWALLGDGKDVLAATGEPGRVLRIGPGGKSETLFDPGETHLRTLARHPERGLIVGGGQKGIVYALHKDGAYALYDSEMDEVTALAVDPKSGAIYAALVSESKPGTLVPDKWIGPVKGDAKADEQSPIKGSEVVRIARDGQVDLLWSSTLEGALGLVFEPKDGRLYISTGTSQKGRARIYAVDTKDRDRLRLVARLEPPLAPALMASGGRLIVGTAPTGRVVRLGPGPRTESVYRSIEQDLRRISEVGRIWFDADVPPGARVELSIRSGNTKLQDATWSPWSASVTDPDGAEVKVPKARYVQLRAVLRASPKGAAPVLKSMHASVVRLNVPPSVKEVFLLRRGIYMASMPKEEEKEKTVTLSPAVIKELRNPFERSEERARARQGVRPGMMTVSWLADDPNRDQLIHRVELRRLEEPSTDWTVVADYHEDTYFSFDSRAHPDGRYQFRVTSSDRPSNPPAEALTDRFESEAFVVDNTAPQITKLEATAAAGGKLKITAVAEDATSRIGVAEVSIAGGPWLMLPSADGLIDAKTERLALEVKIGPSLEAPEVPAGRQTVLVRVEDEAGNASTASTVVVVPAR